MIYIVYIILLSTNTVFSVKNEKNSATIIISNGSGDSSTDEEEEPIVEEVPIPINVPFDIKASFIKTFLPLHESENIPSFFNIAQQSNHYPMIYPSPSINQHQYPTNHNTFLSKTTERLPLADTVKPAQHLSRLSVPLANLHHNNYIHHPQNRLFFLSPLHQIIPANLNINDHNMPSIRYNSDYNNGYINHLMNGLIANPYYHPYHHHPLSTLQYYNHFNNDNPNNRYNMNTFNRIIPILDDHRKPDQLLNNPSLDQRYNHNNRDLLFDIHGPPRNYPLRDSSSSTEQLSSDNPKSDDYEFLGEDEYPQGNSHPYKSNDPYYYSSHSPKSRYPKRNNRDEDNYHNQRYYNRYPDDRDEDFPSEFRDRSFTTNSNGIRTLFKNKDYSYNNDHYYGEEDVLNKILN